VASAGDDSPHLQRQLIVFSLHGEHYGLPIASVREIIRYTPPRVTATARGLIQGLINLRGQVLPVLDLSIRLGRVLEVSDTTRILVIDLANGLLGLIVDAVEGVEQVAADRIEPIPGAGGDDALGDEIVAIEDRLVMLIEPDRALGRVLPGRPADTDVAAPPHQPAPHRAPRPSAPRPSAPRPGAAPPARRRSAATPQMPRSRHRPGHSRDSEE
jgi:purine-binding chemotaxis protein CheW